MTSPPAGRDGAQAVQRALALLQCFRDGGANLSASDLARRLDLTPSTTHRLARALASAGFLEQDDATSRFRIGASVTELGQVSFHQRGLHRASPELEQLAQRTGATADLALRVGSQAVVLVGSSVGPDGGTLRRPLHSTALGKVLLAWAKPGEDLSSLPPLTAQTDRTIVDLDELRRELRRVREAGYALNDGESQYGVRTVAVPILDRETHVRFALALRSTPDVIDDERLPWFLSHARACAFALEVLLLRPHERRVWER